METNRNDRPRTQWGNWSYNPTSFTLDYKSGDFCYQYHLDEDSHLDEMLFNMTDHRVYVASSDILDFFTALFDILPLGALTGWGHGPRRAAAERGYSVPEKEQEQPTTRPHAGVSMGNHTEVG